MNNTLLIIPAYNEAENIERVVDNLIENYPQFDYVVINDGSRDDTRKILYNRGYNYLDLPVNTGLAGAFRCGVRYANAKGYDYVVQFDGDGQHRPESVDKMLTKMQETDADIVIGSRFCEQKKDHSARDDGKPSDHIFDPYAHASDHHRSDTGLRMYNKRMIKLVGYDVAYTPEPDTLAYLIGCGAKVEEVQVEMDERMFGTSYLNLWNSIKYMATVVMNIIVLQWVRKKEVL